MASSILLSINTQRQTKMLPNIKHNSEDYRGAIADYNAAIRLEPNNASMYHNRANAKLMLDKYKESLADYNETIRLEPNNASTYNNRANVKYKLGDHKGALADHKEATRLDPNVENYIDLGISWFVNTLSKL